MLSGDNEPDDKPKGGLVAQLEDLKLSEEQAEAIVELGIKYGAYSDDMPDTKKEKLAAADEIVSFSIDAYINDGITSEDDDEGVAESGRQIEEIMELAGVSIEDGTPVFNDPPEPEDAEDADEGEDEDDEDDVDEDEDEEEDDEEPFNPNDYIEGYSELSVVTKLKKVKELDASDDDDAAVLEAISEWENEQEKPSSRILNYIDEALGEDEDKDEEPEAEEEEAGSADSEDQEEPWDGYDKATASQVKEVLQEAADDKDEPLSREQVEYVLDYERSREKPPPRKRIIDFCNALLDQIDNGGDEEPEAEAEPEEKPKRGRPSKKDKAVAANNGTITITREQILQALTNGEVQITVA